MSIFKNFLIGSTVFGICSGVPNQDLLAQQVNKRESGKQKVVEVVQDSLSFSHFDKAIPEMLKRGLEISNDDLVDLAIKEIYDSFINLPSIQGKEWLKSFKKHFAPLSALERKQRMYRDHSTLETLDEFYRIDEEDKNRIKFEEVLRGKNFRIIVSITKGLIDKGNPAFDETVFIPENHCYGIVLRSGGKEYVYPQWFHVPEKYLHLYDEHKRERPY